MAGKKDKKDNRKKPLKKVSTRKLIASVKADISRVVRKSHPAPKGKKD